MAPVTEIATLFLKAGTDVENPSSSSYKIAQETFSTISSQEGFQRAYYGRKLEDESIMQLFIDWDSLQSHERFVASSGYRAFGQRLGLLLSAAPALIHFAPTPSPPAIVGSAPLVEIATFFHAEGFFLRNVEDFVAAALGGAEGCLGHAFGPVMEEIEQEGKGRGKGRAVVLCVGWGSREMHMAFRETEAFKTNIHLLREGMDGSEMHHVAFKPF